MAKLTRKTLLQFGSTVNAGSEIGQFGSYASPIYSADIATLQAGTAWPRGWAAETVAVNRPFLEDINAVDYVYGYMLCYLFQMGIAEYDSGTTYYLNSVCQIAGQFYISLQDNNTGNAPASSPSSWQPGIPGTELTGVVKEYGGTVAPTGYLLCDGSAVSRSTYAALFAVLGTAYGVGNGTTTFNIPDKRGRVGVGYKSGDADFGTMGQTGGEKTHALTIPEMPAHTHSYTYVTSPGAGDSGGALDTYVGGTTGSTGGDGAHNNLQPYQVFNYIIKT